MTEYTELDNVAALDLETSGLDEQNDQILEVAVVFGSIKDGKFTERGRFSQVLPLASDIENWHERVVEMHSKNGLLAEAVKAKKALKAHQTPDDAFHTCDRELLRVAPSLSSFKARWTLLGNSVHFDLRFVKRVFPQFAARLSHRVFDISATRLFCESLGMVTEPAEVPHRAMPDVLSSIALYGKQADWIKNTFGTAALERVLAESAAEFVATLPILDEPRLGSTAVGHGAG